MDILGSVEATTVGDVDCVGFKLGIDDGFAVEPRNVGDNELLLAGVEDNKVGTSDGLVVSEPGASVGFCAIGLDEG